MGSLPEHSITLSPSEYGRPTEGIPLTGEEQLRKLAELNNNIREHDGELILVIVRHWQKYAYDIPENKTPYLLDEELYIGVITGPQIKEDDYRLVIGTDSHTYFSTNRPHLRIKKSDGAIKPFEAWIENLDRDSLAQPTTNLLQKNKKLLEIVVGTDKLIQWVIEQATIGRMPQEFIDIFDELSQKYKNRLFDAGIIQIVQSMVSELGQEINLPEELLSKTRKDSKSGV